jgi:hypothetical protein
MSTIPNDIDALLLRIPTAEALTKAGFPIKAKTLATVACRGGGPPYSLFGKRALYRWGDALQWAKARMTAPRHSTSEADAAMVGSANAASTRSIPSNRRQDDQGHPRTTSCRRGAST